LRLFTGDDWAENHRDVELMDVTGRRLTKARLPEGVAGIETDRGPWVAALITAGYTVFAAGVAVPGTPRRIRREERRRGCSCAGGHGAHRLSPVRAVAEDTAQAAAIQVVTRTHKTLIWERTRHARRLRHALRDYFPAALEAFEDPGAPDALELLARAPDPASAAGLTTAQISAAFKRARRHHITEKATRFRRYYVPLTWASPTSWPRHTPPLSGP
jgi:hypothetical protein